jgi:hypothetical protein
MIQIIYVGILQVVALLTIVINVKIIKNPVCWFTGSSPGVSTLGVFVLTITKKVIVYNQNS